MGWKEFVFADAEAEAKKNKNVTKKVEKEVKFPETPNKDISENNDTPSFGFGKQSTSFVTEPLSSNKATPEDITNAVDNYKKGFDSLNMQGYNFYQYYQSVLQGGPTNPQTYSMAFAMGTVMDKTITKNKLIEQADYYINKITEAYNANIEKGNTKKNNIIANKNHENQSLNSDLELLSQQLEQIKIQIQDRQNKLKAIDGKYEPQLNDINSKLAANDIAKNQMVQSIQQVKEGISNNLK